MSHGPRGTDDEWRRMEEPFLSIDPQLNIYALANGLDLLKNASGRPDRTLEWYRDGMERRVRILSGPDSPDHYSVEVVASRKEDGIPLAVVRTILEGAPFHELRGRLGGLVAEAVDRANELTRDQLTPDPRQGRP